MQLVGANPDPAIDWQDELPGKANYLKGNDPVQWRGGVATYAKVRYPAVYPGIDLVYYGRQRQLEYDFIAAPGADPKAIRLNFSGTDSARLDAAGDLLLHAPDGELRLHKPVVYQTVGGRRQNVNGRFVLHDAALGKGQDEGKSQQVGSQVAAYDAAQPLVIDPVLVYSTYLGGNDFDWGRSIAVDSAGSAYVTGGTSSSSDFPTVNAKNPAFWGDRDAFVAKLTAADSSPLPSLQPILSVPPSSLDFGAVVAGSSKEVKPSSR